MSSSSSNSALLHKHDGERYPWLGLSAFTEATQHLFFGRDAEVVDIFVRVREHPLTLLYGQSGLGKSSLLGAGLLPKLKVEGFRPAIIRLRFEESDPPLIDQVIEALDGLAGPFGDKDDRSVTLWERIQHEKSRPANLERWPPVLIFDQFEEIFTLGQWTEEEDEIGKDCSYNSVAQIGRINRLDEVKVLCEQLADVIENRPPIELKKRFENDRRLSREYDFSPSPLRFVLTLREDFLSPLEQWKSVMPSLMRNRMPLNLLSGPQALEAVIRPGEIGGVALVDDSVGAKIVRMVARRTDDIPLEEIEAVPPFLSLVCERLNAARIKSGFSHITNGLLESQSRDILNSFYLDSFDDQPLSLRHFVEDRLITEGGHRSTAARDDIVLALKRAGVESEKCEDAIDRLTARRLIGTEERGGVLWVELTHDVIAPLVMRSRDERIERERIEREKLADEEKFQAEKSIKERQTLRRVSILFAVLSVAAIGGGAFGFSKAKEAEKAEALASSKVKEAAVKAWGASQQAFDEKQDPQIGLARLAEAMRYNKSLPEEMQLKVMGGSVASRLSRLSNLDPLPLGIPMKHEGYVLSAQFSPDSAQVVTACFISDGDQIDLAKGRSVTQFWDLESGLPIGKEVNHKDAITSAEYSPDGRRVVTANTDNVAKLLDAESGGCIGEEMRHERSVNSAKFSADGLLIVTASEDETARLWNGETGESIGEQMKHEGSVRYAEFSSDGKRIVTAGEDGKARLWDALSGRPLPGSVPMMHGAGVVYAEFSADGEKLVTVGGDKTVNLWNAWTGGALVEPMLHQDAVRIAHFSPDGESIVTVCDDNTAQLWQVGDGTIIGEPMRHLYSINSAEFSPDGRRVVTASEDTTAQIWDAETGFPLGGAMRHDKAVWIAQFSPSGEKVLTASFDTTARIWNAGTSDVFSELLRHEGAVLNAQFSSNGLFVVTSSGNRAVVWDSETGRKIAGPMIHGGRVNSVEFSLDGKMIVTGSDDKTARVWDARSGKTIGDEMEHDDWVLSAHFSSDGERVVTASSDKSAQVWNVQSGEALGKPIIHVADVWDARFSADGTMVVTASLDNTARVWTAESGMPYGPPMQHEASVRSAEFSGDGQRVVTASDDNTAQLWDVESGVRLGQVMVHEEKVVRAQFSVDGKSILTFSDDGTVMIWDGRTGEAKGMEPLKHEDSVLSAQLSNDGKFVVTSSWNSLARLWDAISGEPLGAPMRHEGIVNSVAFNSGGTQVVTSNSDNTARIWDIEMYGSEAIDPLALEALGGFRVSQIGTVDSIPWGERLEIRKLLLSENQDGSPSARLLQWLFSDSGEKTVSSKSNTTVSEIVDREIDWVATHPGAENRAQIIESIYDAAPGHLLMPFALASVSIDVERAKFLVNLGEARLARNPEAGRSPTALRIKAAALERIGDNRGADLLHKSLRALIGRSYRDQ